jgi:oxygen-independent coproporphyrinogen-3 oxidase
MCQFTTSWKDNSLDFPELSTVLNSLEEMREDGLLTIQNDTITVTEKGKPFVRNICMAFDLRLIRNAPETKLFSMTI